MMAGKLHIHVNMCELYVLFRSKATVMGNYVKNIIIENL